MWKSLIRSNSIVADVSLDIEQTSPDALERFNFAVRAVFRSPKYSYSVTEGCAFSARQLQKFTGKLNDRKQRD